MVRGNFDTVWTEAILHVDMDSFFVEVERRSDPVLRGLPVAVGGLGRRGVIASASYEARAYGVRSAQPTATAKRLCPQLVVVSPSHSHYSEMSGRVFDIFRSFTPFVEGLSLDEAFLDVGGLTRHFKSSVEVAAEIRASLASELGLPASVGVASTKFLAKLASEDAKPDGLRHVPIETQLDFLHTLPIESLWGVGPATLAGLARFGVETVGDLTSIPEVTLARALGPNQGRHLLELSQGIDPRPVEPDASARSISAEETFPRDIDGRDRLEVVLMSQAQRVAGRLRRSGLVSRTVAIKVRYSDFETITRSRTMDSPTDSPKSLFETAKALLEEIEELRPVRLVGLATSGLETDGPPRQMRFDSDDDWRRVSEAVHEARERFGPHAVEPARLIEIHGGETGQDG